MIRISFGIIALNAQPFLEYNLRALYPFAHQLIVVEGATEAAKSLASPDGHSTDGTLEMLKRFQIEEDRENKLDILSAEDEGYRSGFWPEKDHMSRAYARRITGDWLWQIDSDEFYKENDMQALILMLEENPMITAISFPYYEFFGGFNYLITGKWHLFEYPLVHRLFRWKTGYVYATHRPATVVNENKQDVRQEHGLQYPLNGKDPIFMHHYSYVFPKQAAQKVGYYSNVVWTEAFRGNRKWMEDSYLKLKNPLFLGERGGRLLQWLERYNGTHPDAIQKLMVNIKSGVVSEELRQTADIENLLNTPSYWITTKLLHAIMPMFWRIRAIVRSIFRKVGE